MKTLFSIIISTALVVSGYAQTRNVLVGTNNTVVQPTNFWSADASNARTGLGLGTAATNPASAFQSSSATLSNLASSNGGSLTNIRATNLVGIIPASNISTVTFTNISGTLSIASGGTGATNAANARQNLGSTVIGDAVFIATNAAAARTALSLGTAAISSTTDFQPSDSDLTNLANNNAINLTNFPALLLRTNGNGAGLTNLTAANITGLGTAATNPSTAFQSASSVLTNLSSSNAVNLTNLQATNIVGQIPASNISSVNFSNVNGTLSVLSGGTGATNAATARTNLGLGWSALTNTDATNFRNAIGLGSTNNLTLQGVIAEFFTVTSFLDFDSPSVAATTRTNLGLPWTGLTNTNSSTFQAALFGSNTNPVLVNTNGEVVSPTNFWQVAPIVTRFVESQPVANQTTNITAARNLHIHSLAISTTGVTNTIALPTTNSFDGDIALVVHQGPTSSVTAVRTAGAATNLVTLNQFEEAVEFVYYNSVWQFNHNRSFVEPIFFSGTNAAANAAASRTNLGLGETNNVVFNSLHAEQDASSSVYSLTIGQTNTGFRGVGGNTNDFVFARSGNNILGLYSGQIQSLVTHSFTAPLILNYGGSSTSVISFGGIDPATGAAISRTNLGLGWSALTNSNAATSLLGFTTNGQVVANTGTNTLTFTSAINVASIAATNESGFSIQLNNGTFYGDWETVGTWFFLGGFNFGSDAVAAQSRTNLGLPLPALTNTSVTNFRSAIGLGETNSVTFSALTLSSDLTLGSGDNIVLSTTNGTKIGTATNQLLGFYNQTPIAQPSTTGVTTNGFTQGSGNNVHPASTFTGGIGTNAYTISDIVAHLKSLGLIAP